MNFFTADTNATSRFLLPIILPNVTYDQLLANGFKKAYLGMLDYNEYDDSLILIFDKDVEDSLIQELLEIDHIRVEEDPYHEDNKMVVIEDWLELFESPMYSLFMTGQWSKLSMTDKNNILSYWNEKDDSLLSAILYKNHDRIEGTDLENFESTVFLNQPYDKNAELWPAPNIVEEELYYYENEIFDDEEI